MLYNSGEMTPVEQAVKLAVEAHSGQSDADGNPHILHSLEVMFAVKAEVCGTMTQPDSPDVYSHGMLPKPVAGYTLEELMAAAVLHDVVEDTSVTLDEITAFFGAKIAHVVDCVTRRTVAEEKETYRDFIYRTKNNPAARLIKICDLNNNYNRLHRIRAASRKWHDKLKYKYGIALRVLTDLSEPTWEQASTRSATDGAHRRTFIADPNGKEIEITQESC